MTRRRATAGVAVTGAVWAVVGVAAAGTWWWAETQRREAEATMATERMRQRAMHAGLQREQARVAAADAEVRELRAALAERRARRPGGADARPATPATAESRPKPAVPQTWAEAVKQWDLDRDRPERQLHWFAQLREGNRRRFAPLWRRLGLESGSRE